MSASLRFHREGEVLWVTPLSTHADLCLTPEMDALRAELDSSGIIRLIVDLSGLPYFGSTLLELLVVLWRRVGRLDGRLILYKTSPVGREVLSAASWISFGPWRNRAKKRISWPTRPTLRPSKKNTRRECAEATSRPWRALSWARLSKPVV